MTIDLDELERLRQAEAMASLRDLPAAVRRYGEALRNAAPDLLSAARQRDRLRALCLRLHRYVDRLGTDEGTVGAVEEWEGIEGELRGEGVIG